MDRRKKPNVVPKALTENEIISLLSDITPEEVSEARRASIIPMYDTIFFEGEPGGAVLRDINGVEFLDCTSQAWTLNVGPSNPDVIYGAYVQASRLNHVRYGYPTIPRIKLINKLAKIAPGDLKKVCLNTQGGSYAVEAAMKLAMINKPGSSLFVTFLRGYQGSTLATLGASAFIREGIRMPGFGLDHYVKAPYPYCYRCAYGEESPDQCNNECLSTLEQLVDRGVNVPVTGMIVEPMQGPGGQVPAPKKFLEGLRKICNDRKIVLIFDEAQTGFGRIGKWFAAELYGVMPDIICFTKALGGGFPIGGILASKKLKQSFLTPGEEHSTFGANPVSFAAAVVTLEVIERLNLMKNAEEQGKYFTKRIKEEFMDKYPIIGDIRGPGLFIGMEMVKDRKTKEPATMEANAIVGEAFKRHVMFDLSMTDTTAKGEMIRNVVKFKPPLVITREQVDHALDVFEESIKAVTKK
ncbi:MAG: aspartate aminotransferase family protein [Candidatus Atabeyarchaeum deiterrae]